MGLPSGWLHGVQGAAPPLHAFEARFQHWQWRLQATGEAWALLPSPDAHWRHGDARGDVPGPSCGRRRVCRHAACAGRRKGWKVEACVTRLQPNPNAHALLDTRECAGVQAMQRLGSV